MESEALRYNKGKLRWSLVDFRALEDMVRVLEFGASKYSANNWKKGLKTTEILDSMMRHQIAYLSGEDLDPESGLPHTGHILCNAMFLSYMHNFKKEFDSRDMIVKTGLDLNQDAFKSPYITHPYSPTSGILNNNNL